MPWNGGAKRADILATLFIDPNDDDKNQELELRAGAPSDRPDQFGPYRHKSGGVLESQNGDHLKPKLYGSKIIDQLLSTRNPIRTAQLLMEKDPAQDPFTILAAQTDRENLQYPLFSLPVDKLSIYELISKLMIHPDINIRGSMIDIVSSIGVFSNWLANSGYDFILPPIKVPDYRRNGIFFPGGRCDAIGLRLHKEVLENPFILHKIEDLNVRNKRHKHYPNAELFIQAVINLIGADKIESFDIIEFKLGNKEEYAFKQRITHEQQIKKYLEILNVHLNKQVTINGNLIYFGDKSCSNIIYNHDEDYPWTSKTVEEMRRLAQIKAASKKFSREIVNRIKGVHEGKESAESILKYGAVSLEEVIVLSHFVGAARLADGCVCIVLPNNQMLVLCNENEYVNASLHHVGSKTPAFKWDEVTTKALKESFETVGQVMLTNRHDNDEPLPFSSLIGGLNLFGLKLN